MQSRFLGLNLEVLHSGVSDVVANVEDSGDLCHGCGDVSLSKGLHGDLVELGAGAADAEADEERRAVFNRMTAVLSCC